MNYCHKDGSENLVYRSAIRNTQHSRDQYHFSMVFRTLRIRKEKSQRKTTQSILFSLWLSSTHSTALQWSGPGGHCDPSDQVPGVQVVTVTPGMSLLLTPDAGPATQLRPLSPPHLPLGASLSIMTQTTAGPGLTRAHVRLMSEGSGSVIYVEKCLWFNYAWWIELFWIVWWTRVTQRAARVPSCRARQVRVTGRVGAGMIF